MAGMNKSEIVDDSVKLVRQVHTYEQNLDEH